MLAPYWRASSPPTIASAIANDEAKSDITADDTGQQPEDSDTGEPMLTDQQSGADADNSDGTAREGTDDGGLTNESQAESSGEETDPSDLTTPAASNPDSPSLDDAAATGTLGATAEPADPDSQPDAEDEPLGTHSAPEIFNLGIDFLTEEITNTLSAANGPAEESETTRDMPAETIDSPSSTTNADPGDDKSERWKDSLPTGT